MLKLMLLTGHAAVETKGLAALLLRHGEYFNSQCEM